jgi:hypothetical protein
MHCGAMLRPGHTRDSIYTQYRDQMYDKLAQLFGRS